jgi:hypothetical protein
MCYINCGASHDGNRVPSKKRLRILLAEDPASVTFDNTSFFDGKATFTGDEIPEGAKLSVVGPNPYTSRKWWASVWVLNGTIKVT